MSISNLLVNDESAEYKALKSYSLSCKTRNGTLDVSGATSINFFGDLSAFKLDLEFVPVVAGGAVSPSYTINFDEKPDLQNKCVILNYVPTSGTFTYDCMVQIVNVDPNQIEFRLKNLGAVAMSNKFSIHGLLL